MTTTAAVHAARAVDLGSVVALLDSAGLPLTGLGACEIWVARTDGAGVTGVVALETHGDVALVRSLAVATERQGAGLGGLLLDHAVDAARSAGLRAVYALSTGGSPARAHGFTEIVPGDEPPDLLRAAEASGVRGDAVVLCVAVLR